MAIDTVIKYSSLATAIQATEDVRQEFYNNESARIAAEADRVDAESDRELAEDSRVISEGARATAEGLRVTAENGRVSAELFRVSAESGRVSAEQSRVTAENARDLEEQYRIATEGERDSAESGRVSAELARVTAENLRQTNTTTAINNANAATAAANAAAATYELIQFMPGTRFIDGVEAIFALTDETGYVCMFFDADGRGYFPAGIQNLPNAFDVVDMTGITLDAVWGVRDQDGRVAFYIDSQGDFHLKKLYTNDILSDGIAGFAPVSTSDIYCLGDSLTEGSGGTPYTTFLQTLYPLRSVLNGGFAAQNAQQIAARFGASGITLTVTGNQIPASGSVNVTITSGNDPLLHAALNRTMSGTIAGVYGVLTKTFSSGQYSFARQTPGDAVNTSASGEFFFVDNERQRKATCMFWMGRNNVTTGSSQVPVVERAVKQVVSHMKSIQKNFVVLSVLNASDEPSGSSNHTTTLAINAALNLAFPYNYLDIRSILATEPNDTIPAALRSDTIHLNSTGYELVANEIRKFLTLKGF